MAMVRRHLTLAEGFSAFTTSAWLVCCGTSSEGFICCTSDRDEDAPASADVMLLDASSDMSRWLRRPTRNACGLATDTKCVEDPKFSGILKLKNSYLLVVRNGTMVHAHKK